MLGIVYMLFARRWLPAGSGDKSSGASSRPSLADWIEEYKLAGREHRVRVTADSPLVGKTIEQGRDCATPAGATIVAIERGRTLMQPTAKTELRAGDILLVDLSAAKCRRRPLCASSIRSEALPLGGAYFTDRSQEIGMAEVIVPASSELVGKTVAEARVPRSLRPDGDRPAARRGRSRRRTCGARS